MGQIRDNSSSISWLIFSEDLRGHLDVPRLVASEDTSLLFLELPGLPPPNGTDIILEGELTPYIGPVPFDELFRRAATGGLTIILRTDIPTRPIFALPLQVEQFNDWGRAH